MQIPVKEWVTYIKVFTAEYVDIINIQAFLYTSVFYLIYSIIFIIYLINKRIFPTIKINQK